MPHNIVFSKETMMPHMTLYLGFIFFLFSFFWGEGNTDTLLLHCIWWGGNDTFINPSEGHLKIWYMHIEIPSWLAPPDMYSF